MAPSFPSPRMPRRQTSVVTPISAARGARVRRRSSTIMCSRRKKPTRWFRRRPAGPTPISQRPSPTGRAVSAHPASVAAESRTPQRMPTGKGSLRRQAHRRQPVGHNHWQREEGAGQADSRTALRPGQKQGPRRRSDLPSAGRKRDRPQASAWAPLPAAAGKLTYAVASIDLTDAPAFLENEIFERQALSPALRGEFRLLIQPVDETEAQPGDDFDMIRDSEDSLDLALVENADPADAHAPARAASQRFWTAQTVEYRSICGLWVRPRTTAPPRVRSQVTQMLSGALRMPSSFSDRYFACLSPENISAASSLARWKACQTFSRVSSWRTSTKFQGCMKPTDGAWCAAPSRRAISSSDNGSGRNSSRTSRRVSMAR